MKLKKVFAAMLSAVLLLALAACGSKKAWYIESYDWDLTLVQSNEDGSIIGCASEHYEAHKEIEGLIVADLVCSADGGNFTITDQTNNKSYHGNYEVSEESSKSTIYSITTKENTGTAVVSYTEHDDGTKTPTLIITIGGYSLNFQSE